MLVQELRECLKEVPDDYDVTLLVEFDGTDSLLEFEAGGLCQDDRHRTLSLEPMAFIRAYRAKE